MNLKADVIAMIKKAGPIMVEVKTGSRIIRSFMVKVEKQDLIEQLRTLPGEYTNLGVVYIDEEFRVLTSDPDLLSV